LSAVDAPPPAAVRPRTLASLGALYRLLLRTQLTIARILGIAALGGLSVVLGVFSRWDADPGQAAADAISSYGLALVIPLAAPGSARRRSAISSMTGCSSTCG